MGQSGVPEQGGAEKKPGPGGGLGTGARMDKRREDSEAAYGVATRGLGKGQVKGGVDAVSPASAILSSY